MEHGMQYKICSFYLWRTHIDSHTALFACTRSYYYPHNGSFPEGKKPFFLISSSAFNLYLQQSHFDLHGIVPNEQFQSSMQLNKKSISTSAPQMYPKCSTILTVKICTTGKETCLSSPLEGNMPELIYKET
jgi:hypothetical protein